MVARLARWGALVVVLWMGLHGVGYAQLSGTQLIFDANGNIVGSYSQTAVDNQIARWAAAKGTRAGSVASATVDRTMAVGAQQGAKVATRGVITAVSEFTAGELAVGVTRGLRFGVPGILASLAIGAVLDRAHVYFDATRNSMMYNPPSTPHTGYSYVTGGDGATQSDDPNTSCQIYRASHYPERPLYSVAYNNGAAYYCKTFYPGAEDNFIGAGMTRTQGAEDGKRDCPNGVQFGNIRECAGPVSDGQASSLMEPQITGSNGPSIGQDLGGVGGGSPHGDVNPGQKYTPSGTANPQQGVAVPGAPPVVAGQPTMTSAPKTATTSKTNGDGSTTTTTVTTTTVVNNTYNSTNVVNQTVNNYTTTTSSDPSVPPVTTEDHSTPDEPDPDTAVPDQPMGDVPKLYERKYPNGFAGVWTAHQAELDNAPIKQLLNAFVLHVPESGALPPWIIPLNWGDGANFGSYDVSLAGGTVQLLRAFVVLAAVVYARKIIFGG